MSHMLEQAIVDAKALKEAAFNSAKDALVEKYAPEIKQAVNAILEQEEDEMGLGDEEALGDLGGEEGGEESNLDLPLAATAGEKLCPCPDEEEEIEIDFDQLEKQMQMSDDEEEPASQAELATDLGLEDEEDLALQEVFELEEEEDDLLPNLEEKSCGDDEMNEEEIELEEKKKKKKGKYDDGDNKDEKCDYVPCKDNVNEVDDGHDEYKDLGLTGRPGPLDVVVGDKPSSRPSSDSNEPAWERENCFDTKKYPSLAKRQECERENSKRQAAYSNKLIAKTRKPQNESLNLEARIQKAVLSEAKKVESGLLKENKKLQSEKDSLIKENTNLKTKSEEFKSKVLELSETLESVNLNNARLFYTNKVLTSTSLNERQKDKIAEAISRAGSVDEAKTVFDTLVDSVGSSNERRTESLNEVVGNKRTGFVTRQNKTTHPEKNRWQALAGIKK